MSNLKLFCEKQRDLLINEQIDDVIANLRRLLGRANHTLYNEVLNQGFRLKHSRSQYNKGQLTNQEYNSFIIGAINGLLDLLREIENNNELLRDFSRWRTAEAPETNAVTVILNTTDPRAPFKEQSIFDDIVIGRGEECDIVIQDQLISWEHARLIIEGSQVFLEDLDSKNGTFVNGKAIKGNMPITQPCKVAFYNISFDLRLELE